MLKSFWTVATTLMKVLYLPLSTLFRSVQANSPTCNKRMPYSLIPITPWSKL